MRQLPSTRHSPTWAPIEKAGGHYAVGFSLRLPALQRPVLPHSKLILASVWLMKRKSKPPARTCDT